MKGDKRKGKRDGFQFRKRPRPNQHNPKPVDVGQSLPKDILKRRSRCSTAELNEFIDSDGLESAIKELETRLKDPNAGLTDPKRKEAEYLLQYVKEYRTLANVPHERQYCEQSYKIGN